RAGIDQRAAGRIGRHVEALRPAAEQAALRLPAQQKARKAPGQRGLADAAWTRQQPGVVQATAGMGGEQGLLRGFVAEQTGGAPWRRPVVWPFELLELARVDACLDSRHRPQAPN